MNIKKIVVSILILFTFSCSNRASKDQVPQPNELMEESELIPIIIDLQILESHYHRRFQRPDAYKNALDSASFYVFQKHGVTRQKFKDSYTYYSFDVENMYRIYEAALDTINIRISEPDLN